MGTAARTARIAVGAMIISATLAVAPAGATGVIRAEGPLRDLDTSATGPFDGAFAKARIFEFGRGPDRSFVTLRITDIDRAAAGTEYGAHLHLGPCVTDEPDAALGHYNADAMAGNTPPIVNDSTEVWLDFSVSRLGNGVAMTQVPFAAEPGQRSIVIHQEPTAGDGTAGGRLACLPVEWT